MQESSDIRENLIYKQRVSKKANHVMKLNESGRDSIHSLDSGNLFMLRDSKSGNEAYN